jgi:hypothetical protein
VADKAEELLERARKSPENWKRSDLERLYLSFGFQIQSGKKHNFVKHPDYPLRANLPNHTKFDAGWVKTAVKVIERLLVLREQDKNK